MLNQRRKLILEAIVKYFTNTAAPVGSHSLKAKFNVSSATIRSEMSALEKEGLIYQPHTSAGRVPTEVGYRFFVDELIDPKIEKKRVQKRFSEIQEQYFRMKAVETVYDIVSMLSEVTQDIAFATIPENNRTYYMGLSNLLKQPEFVQDMSQASKVIEIMERGFLSVLKDLSIDDKIRIFIGKENIVSNIQSCSMLAVKYNCNGYPGVIGILGPMRMDYSFNIAALEFAFNMFEDK